MKGNKEIRIGNISAIQFKEATRMTRGYLQISMSGGSEDKGGLFDAASDENTVLFKRKQQEDFEKARDLIYQ